MCPVYGALHVKEPHERRVIMMEKNILQVKGCMKFHRTAVMENI
jgi:hypothetical protein